MSQEKNILSALSMATSKSAQMDVNRLLRDIAKKEDELKKVQEEIRSIRGDEVDSDDPPLVLYVDDVLSDVTDGRFAGLVNRRLPTVFEELPVEQSPEEKSDTVTVLKAMLKELNTRKRSAAVERERFELVKLLIKEELSLDSADQTLNNLTAGLEELKNRMMEMKVHPSLNESTRRNLQFEEDLMKTCQKIENFNQYVDAVKTIESICGEDISRTTGTRAGESNLPLVITTLLRDIQSMFLYEEFESEIFF